MHHSVRAKLFTDSKKVKVVSVIILECLIKDNDASIQAYFCVKSVFDNHILGLSCLYKSLSLQLVSTIAKPVSSH